MRVMLPLRTDLSGQLDSPPLTAVLKYITLKRDIESMLKMLIFKARLWGLYVWESGRVPGSQVAREPHHKST